MQLAEKEEHAAEMDEAEEVLGLLLPASGDTAPTLELGEETLDFPATFVAA